ncbi:MAG: AraC family transcriptional regulator [Acidobacteria bacterium]|nr:MAG: AraC family transcriptional regulator [Acidobacteriota bacterium]
MDSRVEAVVEILNQNWNRPLRVTSLARAVGLSTVRLQHLFKKEKGVSIRGYHMDQRLTRAATLLLNPVWRVKEVCHLVGFADLRDFRRSFKRRYKAAPTAFRQASRDAHADVLQKTDTSVNTVPQ